MKKLLIAFIITLLVSCQSSIKTSTFEGSIEKQSDNLNILDINLNTFKVETFSQIQNVKPYNLSISGNITLNKTEILKIQSIFKSLSIKSLDVQSFKDYEDSNFFIFQNLDTTKIESIRLDFSNINEEQGLEKTLTLLKEKINSSPNLENFKYLSLDIGNYRFTEKELKIISEIKIKHFGYNDNEELTPERPLPEVTPKMIEQRRKNIENGIKEKYEPNPMHSKSDEIVKKLLLDSPYLEKILYGDYRWFKKENGKITYIED